MNDLKKEIIKIIEYYNTKLSINTQKEDSELIEIINEVCEAYKDKKYDFTKYTTIKMKNKIGGRIVKCFDEWSVELFLCMYLKRSLDKVFRIKYPNRNNHICLLFDTIKSIQNMNDFTIFKFDFEDYFNSLASNYVYLKYIKNSDLSRNQKYLLEEFLKSCKYCYAGLNTSNVLAEIIASDFDNELKKSFKNNGLIFYRRFVDDGILIFNQYLTQDYCEKVMKDCIDRVFMDRDISCKENCSMKIIFNTKKTIYVTKKDVLSNNNHYFADYLGYRFEFAKNGKNIKIKYGMTPEKMEKYKNRVKEIVQDYKDDSDILLLRHRLKAFACRTVYRRKKHKTYVWVAKGLISNYNELRHHLNNLDADTEIFLKNVIFDVFDELKVDIPFFMKNVKEESFYNLCNSLKNNKTMLFTGDDKIGITYKSLTSMCRELNINYVNNKSYNYLLREYLIKIKIGH